MNTVTLTIGPKSYTVACAEGQEDHIAALGAMIAEKYAQLGASRAPLEAQNLLFAALFLADELAEARKQVDGLPVTATERTLEPAPAENAAELETLHAAVARLEAELAAIHDASPSQSGQIEDAGRSEALADQLEALATRAESIASALEAAAANA